MAGKARIPWVLRWVAFAAIAVAFFFASPSHEGKAVWILVDVSGSMRRLYAEEFSELPSMLASRVRALGSEDRVGLIAFAAQAQLWVPLRSPREFLREMPRDFLQNGNLPREEETNFESAYWVARGAGPSAEPLEFWIWSDAFETSGSLANRFLDASVQGRWVRLPFPEPARWECAMRNLTVPPEWFPGVEARVEVEVRGDSRRASHGQLAMTVGRSAEPLVQTQTAWTLGPGEGRIFSLPFLLERAGEFPIEVELRVQGEESLRCDRRQTVWIRSGDQRSLFSWGNVAGLDREFRKKGRVALYPAQEQRGGGLDGFWIQAPETRLEGRDEEPLLRSIREGAIWVFWGDPVVYDRFFRETPRLRETLPWTPSPENDTPESVVLLLDRSGSMAGGKFEAAAQAAQSLAESLPGNAELRIATFAEETDEPQVWKKPGRPASESLAVSSGPQGARGGTDLEGAIRRSLGFFPEETQPVRRKLLVLSDGRQTVPASSADGFRILAKELLGRQIEFVALAFGEDPDLAALETLTSGGKNGRVVPAASVASLRDLFVREGMSAYFEPGPHEPRLVANSPLPGLPSSAPGLASRLKVKLRSDAQTLYETSAGKPVLAMRREGLGVVICLAADPRIEGDAGWNRDPAVWESILLSLPRRTDRGRIVADAGGATFFPGDEKPSSPELILRDGGGAELARFWKQGDRYRSAGFLPHRASEEPWSLFDGSQAPIALSRLSDPDSSCQEWRGGRSIANLFEAEGEKLPAQPFAFSRWDLLLAAFLLLLIAWLLPLALALPRKGK